MAVRRVRVEFIRFGLLLTMTVALISVAARHGDDSSSREAARQHRPSASPAPSAGQTSAPSRGGATTSPGSVSPGTATTGHGAGKADSGTGGTGTGGTSTEGTGSAGSQTGVATLPRTGGTQAVELAALAALFIAAGSLSLRVSRPRTASVQADAPAAATHPGHAWGSSESNRPGTV